VTHNGAINPRLLILQARRVFLAALLYTALLSACINLLQLTVPLFMLQVHDRVLNSQSMDTLTMLTILAIGALIVFGVLGLVDGLGVFATEDNTVLGLNTNGALSVLSIVFGLLYGEALGNAARRWLGMDAIWFYRGSPDALQPLLLFAIALVGSYSMMFVSANNTTTALGISFTYLYLALVIGLGGMILFSLLHLARLIGRGPAMAADLYARKDGEEWSTLSSS
jgi:ABC-type bacteriocin/lantibiotic exporter with double-glycine peptidase domain